MRERKNDFATSQSDAFAAPGFRLALGKFGLTAESGFNCRVAPDGILEDVGCRSPAFENPDLSIPAT